MVSKPEPAVIREYLTMGPNGNWAWATLVEEVAVWQHLDAGERKNEAVYAATERLSNEFRAWEYRPRDRNSITDRFVEKIIGTISDEFEAVGEGKQVWQIEEAQDRLLACFSSIPLEHLMHLLEDVKVERGDIEPENHKNVIYALYRNSRDKMPIRIGETERERTLRLGEHSWWGRHEMYMTLLEPPEFSNVSRRKDAEIALIRACRPPANREWR